MNESPLKLHADLLREFRSTYGTRREVSNADWYETIGALQRLGEVRITYKSTKYTPQKVREKFDRVKNLRTRYKFLPHDKCFACGGRPDVRHHIIWGEKRRAQQQT